MRRLTPEQARAGAMTIEEAGHNTLERAIQLTASGKILCMQGMSSAESWDSYLNTIAQERPWQHLPEPPDPKRNWKVWLQHELGLDENKLTLLLTGLLGTPAAAIERIKRFEHDIEQPQHPKLGTKGGNPSGANQHTRNRYPGNGSSQSSRRGNDSSYLMARLLQVDPGISEKIGGKGKPYRSIQHAAQELGIVARRQRYELNPEVDVEHAAERIMKILGADKAAELVAAITQLITQQP